MSVELDKAVKDTAEKITQYVSDVATMTVETRYTFINADGSSEERVAARTVAKLDGDSESLVPVRVNEQGQTEVDLELFEVHQRNVATAIEYRARLVSALVEALRSAAGSR